MTDQALWGLLLLVYVVPFWFWQVSAYSTIEERTKLYPGRDIETKYDAQVTARSWLPVEPQPLIAARADNLVLQLGRRGMRASLHTHAGTLHVLRLEQEGCKSGEVPVGVEALFAEPQVAPR